MGGQLAAMHRHTHQHFGWSGDNYIGANPQENTWHEDWGEFFCRQRIRPQLQMAHANGYKFQNEAALYEATKHMLSGHQPEPSLLHGDLWSGNAGFLDDGSPVVYDPACYYGDRETDLAFSEFFGGFPKTFYQAYQKAWPLAQGYEQRKILYNLYHVLNHANLFGGGYGAKAQGMIHSLIE
jgi:fructosamine-3-kinase